MSKYILALDQGTTSSRAILFDRVGAPRSMAQRELPQLYPQPGWVEHDPEAIWATTVAAAREAIGQLGANPGDIAAIGIANQRETTIVWDRKTGAPIHPAIVWQDRRTTEICEEMQELEETYAVRTGLLMDPYFSGTKIRWLLENVRGAARRAERGELAFGTVDSYLVWRLTGGKHHVTDVTNARRTLIFDIDRLDWSPKLMSFLEVPEKLLPEVVPSSGIIGTTDPAIFGAAIPIAGIAGDQQASLFGQACFRSGMGKNTYGTGCFLLRHIGEVSLISKNRLLTTPVAGDTVAVAQYAFEGSVFSAGSAIQWLRDELGLIQRASESADLAASVPDTAGAYLVPAFTGLGAPHWDADARGGLLGLTRGCGRAHIVRAALEGIAYQTRDVVEAMNRDFDEHVEGCREFRSDYEHPDPNARHLHELRVDGGACTNDFLMQFQADMLGIPVVRPKVTETTARGAAFLAGLAVEFWGSREHVETLWEAERTFEPQMSADERDALYGGWQDAVSRVRTNENDWMDDLNELDLDIDANDDVDGDDGDENEA